MSDNEALDSSLPSEDVERGDQRELDVQKIKEEGGFTIVTARKTRRKLKEKAVENLHHDISSCNNLAERKVTETKEEVLRKINSCIDHLSQSEYYARFLEKITVDLLEVTGVQLEKFSIFCLGLGPFSSHLLSRVARYQLALLVLLKEKFQVSVEVYDPVFNGQEKSILSTEFGFQVTEINEEGKRLIESPTLLFMPHCPHQLVNNFLYKNWNPESLGNCYIICNSISEAVSNCPSKYLNQNLCYLPKAHSICTEIRIPNSFTQQPDVFNDIAFHVFSPKQVSSVTKEFWVDKPCPVYTKADFISNIVK